jgi:hypothetical protein
MPVSAIRLDPFSPVTPHESRPPYIVQSHSQTGMYA